MTDHVVVGVFFASVASGLFPWINGELLVAGAAVVVPPEQLPLLILAATAGQLGAKGGIYAVARWAPERLPARARTLMEKYGHRGRGRRTATAAVLSGAAVGLPPFYLVTLAAGVLRLPVALFGVASTLGLIARYAVVASVAATGAGHITFL